MEIAVTSDLLLFDYRDVVNCHSFSAKLLVSEDSPSFGRRIMVLKNSSSLMLDLLLFQEQLQNLVLKQSFVCFDALPGVFSWDNISSSTSF
jgi:hypothetical protein